MKTRSLMKVSLALALAVLMVSASLGAEITPDMDPTPGPGKITSTGKWKVAGTEQAGQIHIIATPAGGGGGKGSHVTAMKTGDSYTGTVENLAPLTEYDVVIYFQYTDGGNSYAVFSKSYKIKTKQIGE